MKSFLFLIKSKILENQEHLELVMKENHSLKNLTIIFIKKIWRNIYNSTQRYFSRPSFRKILQKIEIFFSSKKKINNNYDVSHHVINLKQDGITFFENEIEKINFEKIYNDLSSESRLYSAYEDNNFYLKDENKKYKMGYINTEKLLKNDEVLKLINHDYIIEVLSNYFGVEFIFDNIWSWWSFKHDDKPLGPQNFHRDYNSLNFLKLFIYLTEVDDDSGPHVFIKKSHKKDVFNKIARYNDREIEEKFKKEEILKIKGNKYKIFLANTFCLHKGIPPIKNDRLLLCVLYSVKPSRACPKLPIFDASTSKVSKTLYKNKNLNKMYFKY